MALGAAPGERFAHFDPEGEAFGVVGELLGDFGDARVVEAGGLVDGGFFGECGIGDGVAGVAEDFGEGDAENAGEVGTGGGGGALVVVEPSPDRRTANRNRIRQCRRVLNAGFVHARL